MRRSIALVAAILTVSLGLIASAPAQAGGGHGHGYKHGYKHAYSHGYRHGHGKKHHYRHRRHRGHGGHYRHDGDKFLAAVGIVAGAHVIGSYLQRPPAYQPTPVYAAPVRQPTCYQVMVPYQHPYGGYYYQPQVQCY